MRFLYVAPRYHTNQVPIMRGLIREGHDVSFISQYAGKVEDYSDITPSVVGYSKVYLLMDACYRKLMGRFDKRAGDRHLKCGFPPIRKLTRAIRESKADVAILRERSVYSVFAELICRKYHIPTILYNQSPLWEDRIKNDLPHRIMRALTPSVRMTPVMGSEKAGKVTEPGAVFVPFVMEPEMAPAEREWFKDGKIHVFCIGKYETRKNQQMMIEVIEKLKDRYPLYLTIAGECTTDKHKTYFTGLESYIKEHQLEKHVILLTNQTRGQIAEMYTKSDLFVIPSTLEPASISQLEAMAYSLPVICGDKNGTACYVENGVNGWQFKDNDKTDLKEAVEKVISDPEEMKRMGAESYRLIAQKYQIDDYLKGICKMMNMLKGK